VGGNLLNKIWLPKADISSEVNRFVNEFFASHFMIGIDIVSENMANPFDTKTLIKCAQEIEANLVNGGQNQTVKWFVASDSQNLLDRIVKEYPEKVVFSQGQLGRIEQDSIALRRAILDVELLAKCGKLVLSSGSKNGLLAAMKQLKTPIYFNGTNCEPMSLSRISF
jgi:hypothetical protein